MTRAQPQYLMRANRLCKTHPFGSLLVFTGSRRGKPRGWTILYRLHQTIDGGHT